MHQIIVHNKSHRSQEFEVHGWNDNKNITVGGGKTVKINAADGSSGAIIALHDGHEGEQAEITKGKGNNPDVFDTSVIVGAGGNITVQQVGEPSTRKGAPNFMQDCNKTWHQVDQATRDGLKNCVHLNSKGDVVRIDAPKNFPKLETFCRKFANCKTYIGVGATPGSPGNQCDNEQSKAGKGIRDIIITYNDGNADPSP